MPLAGAEETLRAFSEWEAAQGSALAPEALAAHAKALQMARVRAPIEEGIAGARVAGAARPPHGEPNPSPCCVSAPFFPAVSRPAAARSQPAPTPNPLRPAAASADELLLSQYVSLIALEEKDGEPARVACAFERALSAFPVTAELWARYTRFLCQKVRAGSLVDAAFARALRSCPGSGRLWAAALRAAELRGDAAAVDATFSKAIAKGACACRRQAARCASVCPSILFPSPPRSTCALQKCYHCPRRNS